MDEFDIIVIGGGSAGSAAAGRLSEDPALSVCLIEAGGSNDNWRIKTPGMLAMLPDDANWKYDTVPQTHLNGRIGYQPRGRGLGGSSAVNAMLYVRGNPWDYDNWTALGASGWAWDDVLPYFKRSEHNERGGDALHGDGGPLNVMDQYYTNPASLAFIEAASQLQLPRNNDFNGPEQAGFGLYQVTQKGGERWSAARAYVEPAKARPNLHILTDALVERIIVSDGRASGVQIKRGGTSETLTARAAVILSAGAFGSPQILQLSGFGPADHLRSLGIEVEADRAAIGSDLQDHCDYILGYDTQSRVPIGQSLGGLMSLAGAVIRHRINRTGPMTTPYAESGGFWSVRPDAPAPDVQYHFVPAVLEDHGRESIKAHGFSVHTCVLRPESRGMVRLASKDASAAPLIDPNFLADDRDIALMRDGVRLCQRICEAPALAAFGPTDRHPINYDNDAELDTIIRARADTIYHPVGTCRMGDDAGAVVDPQLRFNGVKGLYVADASIMPRLISGNTNAPSIMIGERCADFVKAHLRA